ncbi:uncharacterized protein ASPGLDRAFT_21589 [Aspergillus glaucus CBS 516.65]|uniref:FAR1 domain-containing protein n=1 Tax=Aspergillus glaucus CBS 516.65 TaxID=1160497 RepID=A0A1L9VZZ1_ASPGL|nr:hypothetical protein ASPGLDRAFT_21589 [Aspergillus glaucus CBS 516.65]OJJ89486.1 hypothetical protein ASPGLDRAFT_21589 [Aspergillus glaucus CBS 516.65]
MCLRASEINMANTAHQQPLQAEYLSDDEDPSPLPPSPTNIIYSSEKEAMDAINEFTQQHGYALTTKSSKRHGNNKIKACYHCDCSGAHKDNVADDKQVHEKTTHYKWLFEIKDPAHSHGPAPAHTHPTLHQAEVKKHATIFENQLSAGITPRQIP